MGTVEACHRRDVVAPPGAAVSWTPSNSSPRRALHDHRPRHRPHLLETVDHRIRRTAGKRRPLAQRGTQRSAAAARCRARREARPVRPRADPGTEPAREGLRRIRRARDHRGRVALHQGEAVPAGYQDADAGPLLHRRGRAGLTRYLARRPRFRAEVLHPGRQLRYRRQQHADLLRPRPDEVP